MKKLYLYLNQPEHMKRVGVIWAVSGLAVALIPAVLPVVISAMVLFTFLMFIGDYPCNWIKEMEG
jgi:putative effector of murein hydrolase LrgA (UPF0299 family)